MNSPTQEGWEVLIPRKIHRKEIHQVRHLPQIVGWRYQPNSHRKSYCGCIICVGQGTIRGRIKNQVWEAKQRRAVEALEALCDALN